MHYFYFVAIYTFNYKTSRNYLLQKVIDYFSKIFYKRKC